MQVLVCDDDLDMMAVLHAHSDWEGWGGNNTGQGGSAMGGV